MKVLKNKNIAVIRTDFKHHGAHSGYKQVLKYLHPKYVFGLDQNVTAHHENRLLQKYLWLYEFQLFKYRKEVDLLFIMYAEEFFRFSWRFMRKAKIVATFHMPPELLAMELFKGNQRGRIGQLTHFLNKRRFSKIDAAIVTSENQRAVLKQFVNESKIHLIPLGVHLKPLLDAFDRKHLQHKFMATHKIITVGNWLRDWDFYFKVVAECPDMQFTLINRNLAGPYKEMLGRYPNLKYLHDVDDATMFDEVLTSDLHFLPLQAMAGNNALLQSLALGCPVLIPDYEADHYRHQRDFIRVYEHSNLEDCISEIKKALALSAEVKDDISAQSVQYASQFDWKAIAEKHEEIFVALLTSGS